jgi:hypothetical protein
MECYSLAVCTRDYPLGVAPRGFLYCCILRMAMDLCEYRSLQSPKTSKLMISKVIALITPYAIDAAGWKFYLLFCVMILLNIPFTYFFLPEVSLAQYNLRLQRLIQHRQAERLLKSLITSLRMRHSFLARNPPPCRHCSEVARRMYREIASKSRSRSDAKLRKESGLNRIECLG